MKILRLCSYLFGSAVRSMKSSWLIQLTSTGTLATAFFIIAGCLLLFQNVHSLILGPSQNTHVSVYFQDGFGSKTSKEISTRFCTRSFVLSCRYVSVDEARDRFLKSNSELKGSVGSLETNPFPASMDLEIDPNLSDRSRLNNFFKEIEAVPGVDAVDDGGGWIARWLSFIQVANWAMVVFTAALAGAMIFVVNNTIKLVVYSRRDEVDILSLVGARPAFIRMPFVLEGLLQGLIASLLALILLHVLFLYGQTHLSEAWGETLATRLEFLSWEKQLYLILAGCFLGIVGSALAVGKFIRS